MLSTTTQTLVDHWIAQTSAGTIAVALHDLSTGAETLVNAGISFNPASTIKVAVMMEVFRQAEDGQFSLDDLIPVKNSFASLVEGLPFALKREDDSEPNLYDLDGQEVSIRSLVEKMIIHSSNLATNLLVERVGADQITAYAKDLGAVDVCLRRGLFDDRAIALGWNNRANARGLMRLLIRLARGEVVSSGASKEMIEIMERQEFNEGIPAGLPSGIPVAHKTGWTDDVYHDAGIIYPPGQLPYVMVVMTQGFAEVSTAHAFVADISHQVYETLAG
ncbi:MAG: class A beta-lactamase-related serine hydrolase [Chloroflexi bacterium]|nr:class A beta-lactamase-related serine hydrolase [Chloroflexota bacterium]